MRIPETLSFLLDSSVWNLIGHVGHLVLLEVRRTRTASSSWNCVESHPPSYLFMRIRETLNLLRDSSVWALIGHTGHFGLLEVKSTRNSSLSRNYLETPPPTSFFMGIRETLNLLPDSSLWGRIRHLGHLGLPEVKRTRTFSLSRNCLETHPPSSFLMRIRETLNLL